MLRAGCWKHSVKGAFVGGNKHTPVMAAGRGACQLIASSFLSQIEVAAVLARLWLGFRRESISVPYPLMNISQGSFNKAAKNDSALKRGQICFALTNHRASLFWYRNAPIMSKPYFALHLPIRRLYSALYLLCIALQGAAVKTALPAPHSNTTDIYIASSNPSRHTFLECHELRIIVHNPMDPHKPTFSVRMAPCVDNHH